MANGPNRLGNGASGTSASPFGRIGGQPPPDLSLPLGMARIAQSPKIPALQTGPAGEQGPVKGFKQSRWERLYPGPGMARDGTQGLKTGSTQGPITGLRFGAQQRFCCSSESPANGSPGRAQPPFRNG